MRRTSAALVSLAIAVGAMTAVVGAAPASAAGSPPPTVGPWSGSRTFYATVGGGFTKGTITWNFLPTVAEGSLRIKGEVKSTRDGCANAMVHSEEWTGFIRMVPDPSGMGEHPTIEWRLGDINEFLIKPVCGLNQSRTFDRLWTVDRTSTTFWWNVWMGVDAGGGFSGWH